MNQSRAIEVTTPYVKINNETRAFPLRFSFSLIEPALSQEGKISFTGSNILLEELTINPVFRLDIPQGRGEHSDPDNPNSTDGDKGPDWTKVCQEAVFYDCPNPVGWAHFYVFPESYRVNSTMKLSIGEKTISFNFGSLEMPVPLRWEKDGCDLDAWIGIIAGCLGTIIAGPVGGTVAGIIGYRAGGDIETNIRKMINGGIAQKLTEFNFQKQWSFK